jgi:hypothetical protein
MMHIIKVAGLSLWFSPLRLAQSDVAKVPVCEVNYMKSGIGPTAQP